MVSKDYIRKIYQSLTEKEVDRLKNLKRGIDLVCIKNYQTNDFSSDSFEDYYDYYTDNIADFTIGKKYKIERMNNVEVYFDIFHKTSVVPNKINFKIFEKIDGNNLPYLFEYFCFEHEWLATKRDEKIESIIN